LAQPASATLKAPATQNIETQRDDFVMNVSPAGAPDDSSARQKIPDNRR
jgi:hypothetical protein